jgi:DNA polymerase-3 subunit beta
VKITVSQSNLQKGLGIVSRAVSPRSTLLVLANVLLKAEAGRLMLAATNLELGIQTRVQAEVEAEGAITVPARLFADLVGTLPNEPVSLTVNPNTCTLTVKCGKSSTEIKGIDAGEFPPMPTADGAVGVEIAADVYKQLVGQVAFAASTDQARPVLQGLQVEVDGRGLTAAATDGFRVAVKHLAMEDIGRGAGTMIIPARAMSEVARIAGDNPVTVTPFPDRGQVIFSAGDTQLFSQLIDGKFPPYEQITPKAYSFEAAMDRAALLAMLRQVEIIARNSNGVVRLNFQAGENGGMVGASATSEESGHAEAEIAAEIDKGDALAIAFNVKFLRESLEAMTGPTVFLHANKPTTPATLYCPADGRYYYTIMPMQI